MITWHPHTEAPIGESIVAIIAAKATADGHRYIMPEQYRYSAKEGEWIGERTGLLLKPIEFDWVTITDVLATLPAESQVQP